MKNANQFKNQRVSSLDCTRAICMLWIIGFWHMSEYVNADFHNVIASTITEGTLAAFTFISGYFLGKKNISSRNDIWTFYKRRILRFYPLFFISATSFLLIYLLFDIKYISSIKQYFLTLIGLSTVITPAPQTIWYINMLILFYVITPFVNMQRTKRNKIYTIVTIYMVTWGLKLFVTPQMDNRLLLYFVPYGIGLIASDLLQINDSLNAKALLGSIAMTSILISLRVKVDSYFAQLASSLSICTLMICLGKLACKMPLLKFILCKISVASMIAYLFHRQVYGVLYAMFGKFPYWFAYIIVLPLMIILSYLVQMLYDIIYNKIFEKKSAK